MTCKAERVRARLRGRGTGVASNVGNTEKAVPVILPSLIACVVVAGRLL